MIENVIKSIFIFHEDIAAAGHAMRSVRLILHVIVGFISCLQSLSATLNVKKVDVGPWIEILTSRAPEHLDKGEALQFVLLFTRSPLRLCRALDLASYSQC